MKYTLIFLNFVYFTCFSYLADFSFKIYITWFDYFLLTIYFLKIYEFIIKIYSSFRKLTYE